MRTNGNGACSIHSVWGDRVSGELFRSDARGFLRDAFGPTPEGFKLRLASEDLLSEMEVALWELLAPIAKQWGRCRRLAGRGGTRRPAHMGVHDGILFRRCTTMRRGGSSRRREFPTVQRKERIVEEFGRLCVPQFKDVFVRELMASLGVLGKYESEDGLGYSGAPALKKYDALFIGTAGARQLQRNVVEQACLEYSFDLFLEKIQDVVGGLDLSGQIDIAPILAFAESVANASDCNYRSARLPFGNFSMTSTPLTSRQWRRSIIIFSATSNYWPWRGALSRTWLYSCTMLRAAL